MSISAEKRSQDRIYAEPDQGGPKWTEFDRFAERGVAGRAWRVEVDGRGCGSRVPFAVLCGYLSGCRRVCGPQGPREGTLDPHPLPQISRSYVGPATSRARPASTSLRANHGTSPATRWEDSPATVRGRARVTVARQHPGRPAERWVAGESSPEPEDGRAGFRGMPRSRHCLAATARVVTPSLFGRAEVSAGSGRSACLESGCLAPGNGAWPPMLPADTSDGRRLVAWLSQGIRVAGPGAFRRGASSWRDRCRGSGKGSGCPVACLAHRRRGASRSSNRTNTAKGTHFPSRSHLAPRLPSKTRAATRRSGPPAASIGRCAPASADASRTACRGRRRTA